MSKIDNEGNYLYYPGVTVISKVVPREFFNSLYHLAKDHCSPLPVSSYHMTVCDLFSGPENFGSIMSRLSILNEIKNNLNSEIIYSVKIRRAYATQGTLGLELSLIPGEISDINYAINEMIGRSVKYHPHLTLGYFYNEIDEDIDTVIEEINKYVKGMYIELYPPRLCYFETMEKFSEIQ